MNLRHDQTHLVWHVCSEARGLLSSTRLGLLRQRKRLPLCFAPSRSGPSTGFDEFPLFP